MTKLKPKHLHKKMGRHTSYKPEYCDLLIGHMGSGLSFESFAAVIKVNQDTLYEWAKVHPDFSEAKKEAWSQSLLFWEKIGLAGMVGKVSGFNATVYIFNMKNRFGWGDVLKVYHEDYQKQIDVGLSDILLLIGDK